MWILIDIVLFLLVVFILLVAFSLCKMTSSVDKANEELYKILLQINGDRDDSNP